MKLTKSQLKQIIKEELEKELDEIKWPWSKEESPDFEAIDKELQEKCGYTSDDPLGENGPCGSGLYDDPLNSEFLDPLVQAHGFKSFKDYLWQEAKQLDPRGDYSHEDSAHAAAIHKAGRYNWYRWKLKNR